MGNLFNNLTAVTSNNSNNYPNRNNSIRWGVHGAIRMPELSTVPRIIDRFNNNHYSNRRQNHSYKIQVPLISKFNRNPIIIPIHMRLFIGCLPMILIIQLRLLSCKSVVSSISRGPAMSAHRSVHGWWPPPWINLSRMPVYRMAMLNSPITHLNHRRFNSRHSWVLISWISSPRSDVNNEEAIVPLRVHIHSSIFHIQINLFAYNLLVSS